MGPRFQGFTIELTNGMSASVIPTKDISTITIGDIELAVKQDKTSIRLAISMNLLDEVTNVGVRSVTRKLFDKPANIKVVGAQAGGNDLDATRQACSECNGTSYCVTNACVNIGCGWLCDTAW